MKKQLLFLSILSIFFISGCVTSPSNNLSKDTKTITTNRYENKQYRLKLDFPSNWTFEENAFGEAVVFSSPSQENNNKGIVGVAIKLISSGTTIEDLYKENKKNLILLSDDLKIESEKDTEIDYYPAKDVVYTFSQGGINFKQKQVLVIKEELVYMFSYISTADHYNEYKKDADKIIYGTSIR